MRVLIVGYGSVGAAVAMALTEEGHMVKVMDTDPETFRVLPENSAVAAVVGDGTIEEDLRKAGIEEVDVFIAVTPMDARNALASQMAHHIFNVSKVVCRINDPARQEMYERMGLHAVSPTKIISDMIMKAVH